MFYKDAQSPALPNRFLKLVSVLFLVFIALSCASCRGLRMGKRGGLTREVGWGGGAGTSGSGSGVR